MILKQKTENGNLNKTNWFSLEFYETESFGQFESCPTKRLAVMVAMQKKTILGVPSRNSMPNKQGTVGQEERHQKNIQSN